jgi:hypothetical protein
MTPCANKTRFAKPLLAALAGAGWLGWLATATPAQTVMLPVDRPLYFEADPGRVEAPAQFIARGRDALFLISPAAAQFVLRQATTSGASLERTVRMQFAGASGRAQLSGAEEMAGKINYFTGNDPARWQTGVPAFGQVRVAGLYPGVNLAYHANQRRLEYDFTVAPGADPGVIAIRFEGADNISVNPAGDLVLRLGDSEIRQPKPEIYQTVNGVRQTVRGGFTMLDARTVAFAVGDYDRGRPLVIDPILSYSTYFGGNSGEDAWAAAVDVNGFVYIAGQTFSTQFTNWPVPPGAFQTTNRGGAQAGDAFVAKFDSLGTNLIYLTYLGGSGDDAAYGLGVDAAGNAFVAGATVSANFPIQNALYTNINSFNNKYVGYSADAFIAQLGPAGSNLVYSTFLGGESADAAFGLAVDAAGNAYVTGFTYSTNFPVTNAFQQSLQCPNSVYWNANAFVTKIGAGGSPLVYSTYLGGTNFDEGQSIAVDGAGCAYVTGFTVSTNFPTTNFVYQFIGTNLYNGHWLNDVTNNAPPYIPYDAFVTKFSPSGSNLVYSTFLGGANYDVGRHIAVDAAGNAYVTGGTTSTNFPNTITNLADLHSGVTNNLNNFYYYNTLVTNAFLTQIAWDGIHASFGYSTVFGGTNASIDVGQCVAVDALGNAFVMGTTSSTNFPCYPTNNTGFLRSTNSGLNDVFITVFAPNAGNLLYSGYLGGSGQDAAGGIALDPAGNAYLAGSTDSTNFPTLNARQATRTGTNDVFLAKILLSAVSPVLAIDPAPATITLTKPAWLPEYQLESNTNLLFDTWTLVPVPSPAVLSNGLQIISLPVTGGDVFFRLHRY